MQAFILETLLQKGWRKGGEIFWTLDDAVSAAENMIKRKLARRVRILPAQLQLEAVQELPAAEEVRA